MLDIILAVVTLIACMAAAVAVTALKIKQPFTLMQLLLMVSISLFGGTAKPIRMLGFSIVNVIGLYCLNLWFNIPIYIAFNVVVYSAAVAVLIYSVKNSAKMPEDHAFAQVIMRLV